MVRLWLVPLAKVGDRCEIDRPCGSIVGSAVGHGDTVKRGIRLSMMTALAAGLGPLLVVVIV